ncbi:MAG: hypothetical protein ABWZ08_06085 [Pseudoxanthomonas sp.]
METPSRNPGTQSRPARSSACCDDAHCDSGKRNRYFAGKRMTPDSLRVEQRYHLERRRLINRAMHGWGVVYGFALRPAPADSCGGDGERRLRIGAGLAFDACGRELVQAEALELDLDDVLSVDAKGCLVAQERRGCRERGAPTPWDGADDACWLLSAHYAERLLSPLGQKDACGCEGQEWDHVCETVVYSLRRIDCDACCAPQECGLHCECASGPCCGEDEDHKRLEDYGQEKRAPAGFTRGGCSCLCEHLAAIDLDPGDCDGLCEVNRGVRVASGRGVPLACVKLERDRCGDWTLAVDVDQCGPRRLVKRNDLLFDLIRGCDLTRISAIGWASWHRSENPVDWNAFSQSFGSRTGTENATDLYWVRFSKPVRIATVRPDCFAMTFIVTEDEGGWGQPHRVPITRVEGTADPGDPKGTWREVRLVVDADWVDDAIRGRKTVFHHHQVLAEIEIRGDFILDCNGQAVDANAIGLSPAPSGNGVPGDSFLSTFRVGPRPSDQKTKTSEAMTTGGAQ